MRHLPGLLLVIALATIGCGRPESPQSSAGPAPQAGGQNGSALPPSAPITRRPAPALATAGDLTIARGATARLVLRVSLPKGLHVQSDAPADPALIATALTLNTPPDVSVVSVSYPKPITFSQPAANLTLAVFESEFEIVVTVRAAANATPGALVIPGALRFQACNDSICFAPSTVDTEWKVQVT